MITLANKEMFPALIHIWQESFGDSEAYIRMFLDANFHRVRTVVYVEEGAPVSVAYLMPMDYVTAQRDVFSCLYLYAAATLPQYRGRGYFGEILSYVKAHMEEPVLLVPGEPELVGYYERQGLRLWNEGAERLYRYEPAANQPYRISHICGESYYPLREQALAGRDHFRWDEDLMQYICAENKYCGGRQAIVSLGQSDFLVMYRTEGHNLYVLELLPVTECMGALEESLPQISHFLLQKTGCQQITIHLQPPYMIHKAFERFNRNSYFNLTLG